MNNYFKKEIAEKRNSVLATEQEALNLHSKLQLAMDLEDSHVDEAYCSEVYWVLGNHIVRAVTKRLTGQKTDKILLEIAPDKYRSKYWFYIPSIEVQEEVFKSIKKFMKTEKD